MINRNHIRQFLAVVDCGNFTRAAHFINVTQPTLSGGIAQLEQQLGVKLFIREKRRIQLTEAGDRFLKHARTIQSEFQKAERNIVPRTISKRIIQFGVLESIASSLIEAAIKSFQNSRPTDQLTLVEGKENEIASGLIKNRLDLAVTLLPEIKSQHSDILLFEEDYCLMIAKSHALAHKDHVTVDEVSHETMIARRSCELLGKTSKFFTARGVRPPFSLRSTHEDRVMKMVRAGLGITIAPHSHLIEGVCALNLGGFNHSRKIGIKFSTHWREKFGADHPLVRVVMQQSAELLSA